MGKSVSLNLCSDGKPVGMSDKAWMDLHKLIAKIHVNHADEIKQIQNAKRQIKKVV